MSKLYSFSYPDIPSDIKDLLFLDDKHMIVVGVLGKSRHPNCNKMSPFDVLDRHPSLLNDPAADATGQRNGPKDGDISFYFERNGNILYMHFVTPFDRFVADDLATQTMHDPVINVIGMNSKSRLRFAQSLLLAIQMCHIVVLVETSSVFDAAYLSMFKALKIVRDKFIIPNLPKLLKNTNAGSFMGKDSRICSPRFMFYFAKCLHNFDDVESLNQFEFEVEDKIYKMLRNEFIITNNSAMSLFSIPRNKRFVYINSNAQQEKDPLTESIDLLHHFIESMSNKDRRSAGAVDCTSDLDEIRPYRGFAKPLKLYTDSDEQPTPKSASRTSFSVLLKEHVAEAMANGFDDSVAKFKGKTQFVVPTVKSWFEAFGIMQPLFLGDEQADEAYRTFQHNFSDQLQKLIDFDERFFADCCEYGQELALDDYRDLLPAHYSYEFHVRKSLKSYEVLAKYARVPAINDTFRMRLQQKCDEIWLNGRQQCESPSLRGNPCVLGKHVAKPDAHSSGVVYVSTCNCGRIQGRREDPYTIREANYDFYQLLAANCPSCNKLESFNFKVFEPSICDFRAADVEPKVSDDDDVTALEKIMAASAFISSHPSSQAKAKALSLLMSNTAASQRSQTNLSLTTIDPDDEDGAAAEKNNDQRKSGEGDDDDDDDDRASSHSDSVNEIVIKVGGDRRAEVPDPSLIMRQPSTTEYLPGMVHAKSRPGLLPQFPSWSLVCIGPSSVYSHNTGLPEHVQSGFMSGSNFLLPWDVHVRLEHAASWAASYEKSRSRKKPTNHRDHGGGGGSNGAAGSGGSERSANNQVFMLKIFIGCEYECPRGHRFIMNSPDKVLRGGSGIVRDSGSKVVFNDMPLYFPCPCRGTEPKAAQLMRIHIVTPKAPVNVIIEPKVRVGPKGGPIFLTGLPEPAKLTQSAYWVLRLPYVYQGDEGPLVPPATLTTFNPCAFGCLMGAMYGIKETEGSNHVL